MSAPSGTVWGSISGGYGQLGIYAYTSSSNTQTTVNVEVWFWTKYSISDSDNNLYFDDLSYAGSASTNRGSVSISTTNNSGSGWSPSNQVKIYSYSYTHNRGTSASTRYLYATLSGINHKVDTVYANTAVTIPALPSYTISYNANDGSGAPSSQTKFYGIDITLSSTKPSRTGYSFQGWATSSGGSVSYSSGASYTSNSSATLYAVWKANTYTVSYNANGGTGAPSNQTKTYGVTLKISSTKPARINYNFLGWGTSASATTVQYSPGSNYTNNSAITLYAIWELAYTKPKIKNLSVDRCDSSGLLLDDGTYANIKFDWVCDANYQVASVKIEWKRSTSSSYTNSTTISSSETSGSANEIIGSNDLDPEYTYSIRITVADTNGSSYAERTLNSMKLPIDVLPENNGIAFGKPASIPGAAEFEYNAVFNNSVSGRVYGLDALPEIASGDDLNDYLTPGCYGIGSIFLASSILHMPKKLAGRLIVSTSSGSHFVSKTDPKLYICQEFIPFNSPCEPTYKRYISTNSQGAIQHGPWYRENGEVVLWSGAWHMNESHSITLRESISIQPTGIVLVFSHYTPSTTTVDDYGWNTFFVPKYIAAVGGGQTFIMGTDAGFSAVCAKYLYIYDRKIDGHATNTASGTNNGITFDNAQFVLRYVIGV